MNQLRPKIIFVFFLLNLLTLLIMSRHLTTKNSETLFLNDSQHQAFMTFRHLVEERPFAIFLIETEGLWLKKYDSFCQQLELKISQLNDEDIHLSTFFSVYAKALMKEKTDTHLETDILSFLSKHDLKAPLLSPHYHAVIVNLPTTQSATVIPSIYQSAKDLAKNIYGKDLMAAGPPIINMELDNHSRQIKQFLFPIMFFLCFIFLAIILKDLLAAWFIFMPSLLGSALSLYTIQFFYHSMNMITSIVPLLIFSINLTLGLHLFFAVKGLGDIKKMLKHKFSPIALMLGTTIVGLASLYFSQIEVIRQFSILSTSLLMVSSLIHIAFAYLCYPMILSRIQALNPLHFYFKKQLQLQHFFSSKKFYSALVVLFILGIFCINKIPLETEAAAYFPKNSILHQSIQIITKNIFGNPNFDLIFQKQSDWNMQDIQQIKMLEQKIIQQLPTGYKILSPIQFTSEANAFYQGRHDIPDSKIAFLALYASIKNELAGNFLGDRFYRLQLLGPFHDAATYHRIQTKIENIVRQAKLDWKFSINGTYFHLKTSQENLVYILGKSFFLSLIIISIGSLIYFKSLPAFFLFLMVNIFPITFTFLFMKIFGLSLNLATIMTFSIALGLVVDGTYHILHSASSSHSQEYFQESILFPIALSSLLLSFSLAILGFNSFLPIREFGITLAFNILAGGFFDIFVLPPLLNRLRAKSSISVAP